jgi:hypothetical protein
MEHVDTSEEQNPLFLKLRKLISLIVSISKNITFLKHF